MPARTPEEAYNRLAVLWAMADFEWDHEFPFSEWIAIEYEVSSPRSRDVYDRFDATCNLVASLEEFEAFTGFRYRVWPLSPRVDKNLTLGDFSVWLLDNSDLPETGPLNIAGKLCEQGGIFLGMSDVVKRETGENRIRPSSRIADVLSVDQLCRLLWQTQVATGRLLKQEESSMARGCAALLVTIFGIVALIVGAAASIAILAFLGASSVLAAIVAVCLNQQSGVEAVLPHGIETFADLAREFAQQPQLVR